MPNAPSTAQVTARWLLGRRSNLLTALATTYPTPTLKKMNSRLVNRMTKYLTNAATMAAAIPASSDVAIRVCGLFVSSLKTLYPHIP